jgi:hypothetical protein
MKTLVSLLLSCSLGACGVQVAEPAPTPVDEAALMPVDTSPAPPELDFQTVAEARTQRAAVRPAAPARLLTTAEIERLRGASPRLERLLKDSKGVEEVGTP